MQSHSASVPNKKFYFLFILFLSVCGLPLGMEDERIEDKQLSHSKSFIQFSSPTWGRLKGPKAWCASIALFYLSTTFIQVDFLKATWVTDKETQGSEYHNAWVTRYSLKYKDSGHKFALYQVYIVGTKMMSFN